MATEENNNIVNAAAADTFEASPDSGNAEPAAAEIPASKPAGKSKNSNKAKPKKAAAGTKRRRNHHTYEEMITNAITSLKERTGSSQYAIAKFIEENYKDSLPANFRKTLLIHLKKLVDSEKLVKVKNSFKLPSKRARPSGSGGASKSAVAKGKENADSNPKEKKYSAPRMSVRDPSPVKKTAKRKAPEPKAKAVATKPKVKAATKAKPVAKAARTSTRMSVRDPSPVRKAAAAPKKKAPAAADKKAALAKSAAKGKNAKSPVQKKAAAAAAGGKKGKK